MERYAFLKITPEEKHVFHHENIAYQKLTPIPNEHRTFVTWIQYCPLHVTDI